MKQLMIVLLCLALIIGLILMSHEKPKKPIAPLLNNPIQLNLKCDDWGAPAYEMQRSHKMLRGSDCEE